MISLNILLLLVFCAFAKADWGTKIVEGLQAEKNQFPYQVGVFKNNAFSCGGSIIA